MTSVRPEPGGPVEPTPTGRLARLAQAWQDDGSVVPRQVPFTALFVLCLLSLLVPGIEATAAELVVLAGVVVAVMVTAALALPWRALPVGARLSLPGLQLMAVGLLRAGTGGPDSPFTSLLFLPVVLAASERGRRGVAMSTAAAVLVVLGPTLQAGVVSTPVEVARAVLLALVVLVVGITVNAIMERRRVRTQAVQSLRDAESALLDRAQTAARELAERTEEVRRTRDLFASVIDAATEQAIIGTDVHGVIDLYNPGAERLLALPADEVLRRTRITDLHDPAELTERRDELNRAAGPGESPGEGLFGALVAAAWTGGSEVRDWTYMRGDGRAVVVRVAVTRRLDPDGSTSGYIFVATDMTAEREAARLKDEFVSLISHELRTPLSSILGYLELTVESGELSAEQRGYVAVIERNANRLLRLVGDLLFTAQVEAGQFALVRAPVDVGASVRAAVESARPGAVAAGVELVLAGAAAEGAERVVVGGDAVRLGQAWDNLISNAVKFTGAGGQVVLDVREDARTVTVTVSDTGVGIAAGDLDRLFGRFFRAQSATRNAVPGVGLGLAITRAIVTAHGGDLQVRSALGQGTAFEAVLPREDPNP